MSSTPMTTSTPAQESADYVKKHHTNDKKYGGPTSGGGYGGGNYGGGSYRPRPWPGPRPGFPGRPGYPHYPRRPYYPRWPRYGGYGRYGRHRPRWPYHWRPRRRWFGGKYWYWYYSRWVPYWPFPYAFPGYGFY